MGRGDKGNDRRTGRRLRIVAGGDTAAGKRFKVACAVSAQVGAVLCSLGGLLFSDASATTAFPAGSEFQVNTYTTFQQSNPAVASRGDGDFVVVWSSRYQDRSGFGVFGQRYASNGDMQGSEFQVNTYTINYQSLPAVAAASDGDFIVVWNSAQEGVGSPAFGIFGQRYASGGNALGTEFHVNTYTTQAQHDPAVACDPDGKSVVVWESDQQDGAMTGVFAQRYASNGDALGTEFQVNTYTIGTQDAAAVAVNSDGDFIVVWNSANGQDGSFAGVFGQRYASSGSPLGMEFQVNTYTLGSQGGINLGAAVSVDDDRNFVVVWLSDGQDGSSFGVFGQRFASSGSPLGTEFQINTYTTGAQGSGKRADISTGGDGNFVVVWGSNGQDGSSLGVFSQRYASTGDPIGTEFQVNTFSTLQQAQPAVLTDNDGDFVVVWNSRYQDGSDFGVFGQRFQICGNGVLADAEECDDGNNVGGDCCSATCQRPSGCKIAGKSILLLKNNTNDTKDKVAFKWLKGDETMLGELGSPTGMTNYMLCLYAGTASASISMPSGSNWQPLGTKGYKYKDTTASLVPDGAQKAVLKSGPDGKAKVLVKGKGTNLPDDLVPELPLPVTALVVNDANNTCFEAIYDSSEVIKNDAKQFKAKVK